MFLSQEEFGLTRLVLSLTTLMAQFSSFGVNRIAIKFFPVFRRNPHKNNGLLIILFLFSLVGFILVLSIFFIFKDYILSYYRDDSALLQNYYSWLSFASLGLLLFLIFESFLQALQKTVFTNFLRNVVIKVYWLVSLLLYSFGAYSFFTFMLIYMSGYFFTAILCIIQLIKNNEFVFDYDENFYRKRLIKPMINYGLYTLFSSATLIVIISVDLLMIGALIPDGKLKYIGIYAIATYIVSVIYIPSNSLIRIASPIIANDWRNRDLKKIDELYKKSSYILVFLGGIIFGCIFLNIDDILSLMKPEYAEAKYIIIILGISRLFDLTFGLNYLILVVTKFYRVESILTSLLLILVIVTNYIYIPLFGINGAAFATASVFLFYNITLFFYIWIKLKLQPFSWATLQMIFLGIIAGAIVFYLPLDFSNKVLLIIFKSSIFCLLYTIPVYFLKISLDINFLINRWLDKTTSLIKKLN